MASIDEIFRWLIYTYLTSRQTCCKTNQGYDCCPYPEAVCCSDKKHCCPRGYKCSPDSKTCSSGSHSILALSTSPPKAETKVINRILQLIVKTVSKELFESHTSEHPKVMKEKILKNVICPDEKSECPNHNTCCKLASGQWGCCPLPKAVCCSDGIHCCPNGYMCNAANGTCSRGADSIPMSQKVKALERMPKLKSVFCPDGQSQCPDGNTCCKLASGQWGCCPLPKAVCCSDGVHCCPNGYTCNAANGTCSRDIKSTPMLQKVEASMSTAKVNSVVCPDGHSKCPNGNTCCKLKSGQYGCCPLPKAVCCSDGVHCCPNGYTCNVANGTCRRNSESIPMLQKAKASNKRAKENVVCPDGKSQCPDGNTCCKLASGQWGCCPLPKAVCCSDGIHCCPNGYTCDPASGTCSKGRNAVAMLQKTLLSKESANMKKVYCADGKSVCPDGNTCCELSSGKWNCCPFLNAVCCKDGEYCCPEGYICDSAAGKCYKGVSTVPMLQKVPALKRKSKASIVKCPDGRSECPDGSTCCELPSGGYGCCPLPKAVCCKDKKHCCPNGYTCNVANGTCNPSSGTRSQGRKLVPMLEKMPVLKQSVRNVICPDEESECPDGQTCCKLSSGQYGCCPLPNSVCCNDGEHCCPEGYTCDTTAGTCNKRINTVPMLRKMPALKRNSKVNIVKCPDGQSECPDGSTCCELPSGAYGCCSLPQAVCCEDKKHCCPNGYTCNVAKGTCKKEAEGMSLQKTIPVSKTKAEVGNGVCPDGASQCPDGNTCCKLASGQYGCCPLPKAVCCSDGVHCCPNGYMCDPAAGTCTKGIKTIPMIQKMPALKKITKMNVVCPGGQSQCPDGNTCCQLASGQYGCCPLPKAVCCSDGVHCCPNGYTCDVSNGTCSRGSKPIPMLEKKIPASKVNRQVTILVCPDKESECPDGQTCCKLDSGHYGCCPLPNAVCCSDEIHCCPNGYTCDLPLGTCNKGMNTVPMSQTMEALKQKVKVRNVICPDEESECPDGNTCCKLSTGEYGCCPLPYAVCCSDGAHCCPNGYTCDVAAGTCSRGSESVSILQKIEASKRSVVCPGGQVECPNGNTCCKLSTGEWGCCPLPDAVCCSDGKHCCPEGYTCNVANGSCSRSSESIPMLLKIPASKGKAMVICPGDKVQCLENQTCCKLRSGEYGCCPAPSAVCCSDGENCCPHGFICDLSTGTCIKEREVLAWQKMVLTKSRFNLKNVVCPDSQSECPDGSTCCKLSSGQYGCCPLPDAVCCSDGVHCCPDGYTCDPAAGTCTKGMTIVSMLHKMPAQKTAKVSSIVCPDGQSQCPNGQTCCKLSSGQYGCCPLPSAVCCSDGEHCCPEGYTCVPSIGTCVKEIRSIPMLQTMPALTKMTRMNVVCPDGQSQCPSGNTCCKLSSGQYGCCPLPDAVCCSDGVHCCPEGYTCDPSAGTCTKGSKSIPMLQKMPASKRSFKMNNVVCPGGQSECPDGNTCCKLSSGQYGCCPLPSAVCCSDGVHCCPQGYTCDTSAGTCTKGSKTIPMLQKMPALKRAAKVNNVVCPGGQSECPDGNTCCKLSSGQYGCCPLPSAVCCSDGEHCCPEGYTCDTSAGTCTKESKTIPMLQKIPALKRIAKVNVVCPGGQSQCPNGNTCCKLASGSWGCCPLPNAVCCSDGIHCCPKGTTCDVSTGQCQGHGEQTAMSVTQPSKQVGKDAQTVFCPDGESECPNGYTCCKDVSGQFGCCLGEVATCCSDKVHCCPQGYTCNSNGTCRSGPLVQGMVSVAKSPAQQVANLADPVICPDKKYQCPSGSTCCKLHSGAYGCCPIENAVCCTDDKHCCPEGYACDVKHG